SQTRSEEDVGEKSARQESCRKLPPPLKPLPTHWLRSCSFPEPLDLFFSHEALSLRSRHPPAMAHGRRAGAGPVAGADGLAPPCRGALARLALHHRPLRG